MARNIVRMGLLYVVAVVAMLVVGHHVTLPDAGPGTASPNSFTVAFLEATGRREPTDFLIDYASARALRARTDPYATSAVLIDRFGGPSWPVSTANPHPPTLLPIVLPFSLLNYHRALAAWVVAMIFAMILTIRFVGIRWAYAIEVGTRLARSLGSEVTRHTSPIALQTQPWDTRLPSHAWLAVVVLHTTTF